MPLTFDTVASGSINVACDTFTQDSISKSVMFSALAWGPFGGPYETVDTSTPLPIQGTVTVSSPTDYVDDSDWTALTSKHKLVGVLYQSSPGAITDGDTGPLRGTANGAAHVSVQNASIPVTQATAANLNMTEASAADIKTSVQLLDNVVFVNNSAWNSGSSQHLLTGGIYQASPQTITDGRSAPILLDANGRVQVTVNGTVTVGSHAVTNAGTFAVQVDGAALTALQLIDNTIVVDDAAFTPGTTSVNMAGFTFDDTSPDTVNEGDAGAARMSSRREIYTQIRDAAGNERGLNVDGSGNINVTTCSTVTNVATIGTSITPGTSAAHLGKAVDAAAGASDTGVAGLYVRDDALSTLTPAEGDYVYGRVDSTGAIWVNVAAMTPGTSSTSLGKAIDAAAGGTDTVVAAGVVRDDALSTLTPADGDYTVLRVTATGALWGQDAEGVAHDAADSGNPKKIGGKASTTAPTAVSANDRVNAWFTLQGVQVTVTPPCLVDENLAVSADVNAAVAAATGLRLLGYTWRETAAGAFNFRLVNGPTVAGAVNFIANVRGAADTSGFQWIGWPGIPADSGITIDHIAGTFDLQIFYGVLT